MTKILNKSYKYALISVFDKTGIVEFAKVLQTLHYNIISTGGTATVLQENNIPVVPIQEITGNPESFDGRMKTISFQVESGILFDRTNKKHVKEAKELKIKPIDIVVCNLYPFEQAVQRPNVTLEDAVENIDVGGPTMIRAASKNFKNVLVVVDPNDYEMAATYLKRHPERSEGSKNSLKDSSATPQNDIKKALAAKAFAHLSFYDGQIVRYLENDDFPNKVTIPGRKIHVLRYGENPHQQAALYIRPNANSTLEHLKKEWGRDLSLTNVTDIQAGIESVRLFRETPAAVIIKHNNPCGIALGITIQVALDRAIEADPESAFGGVVVINKTFTLKAAKVIGAFKDERRANIDIVAAPKFHNDALAYLKTVRKTMGIYALGEFPKALRQLVKWIDGGFILQTDDTEKIINAKEWKTVTKKKPSAKQTIQMQIAWKFIARIRSNAVIVVDKTLLMTRGIGSGQTSRVRSTRIALEQAGKFAKGAILASDSFFPFDDSVKLAAKYGISAIVQQGGSVNDQLSIDAADRAGIAMVFTGRRAFWH